MTKPRQPPSLPGGKGTVSSTPDQARTEPEKTTTRLTPVTRKIGEGAGNLRERSAEFNKRRRTTK